MYIPYISEREQKLARVRARVAELKSALCRDYLEFELYLNAKPGRGRQQLREYLWSSVTEFRSWEILSGFL